MDNSIFFCDVIESILKEQADKIKTAPTITKENTTFSKNTGQSRGGAAGAVNKETVAVAVPISPPSPNQPEAYETSFFIDSITGKHISLQSKHVLNLLKIAQSHR